MREALLIVAHGDCGGDRTNGLAMRLADAARRGNRFAEVQVGFMKGEPSLETTFAAIASNCVRLLPLFLSDGYYVETAIPRRLGLIRDRDALGRRVAVSTPLGLDPQLPQALAQAAAGCARRHDIAPAKLNILLVAHGSKTSDKSAHAAERIAAAIDRMNLFATVSTVFLEQVPFFADVLPSCASQTLVIGLFAGEGQHAVEDVGNAVTRLQRDDVFQLEQLSGNDAILEVLLAGLARA